jgi:hypothetical protein
MLKKIINSKSYGFWIGVHALLGVLATFSLFIYPLWFFIFSLSSFAFLSKGSGDLKKINLLYLITYLASSELILRMTKAFQYKIPWEFGKYTLFFGFLFGVLFLNQRKGLQGFMLFVLLLPSLFLGPATHANINHLVGNLFGPLAIALSIVYCYKLRVTKQQLVLLLKLILLPTTSVLAYTVFKNPDFSSYQFDLAANFDTAGGFGSNQVSTILGLGSLLVFIFVINGWPLFKTIIADYIFLGVFSIQGLLTFSRGGMIGMLVGVLVILYIYTYLNPKIKRDYQVKSIGKYVIVSGVSLFVLFMIADSITGGLLQMRYSGETNATMAGIREKDLNVLTTNRYDIFMADLELWKKYPILGVGVAGSQILRGFDYGDLYRDPSSGGIAAHVELSRLLAEHGIFGLIYFIILLLQLRHIWFQRGDPRFVAILLAFYFLALYTTFHAATRTFVSPLLFGLSLVQIVDIKRPAVEDEF